MLRMTTGLTAIVLALAACGSSTDPAETPTTDTSDTGAVADTPSSSSDAQTPTPASDTGAATSAEVVDPLLKRGRIVWLQCRSCHTLKDGEPDLTGPNLYGVFGRTAGQYGGFGYSTPLKESGIVWDAETLNAWLEKPDQYISGNVMAYAGLRKPSDRDAVIAYLAEETK